MTSISDLPNETIFSIIRFCDLSSLGALLFTSRRFNEAIEVDPSLLDKACAATPRSIQHHKKLFPLKVVFEESRIKRAIMRDDPRLITLYLANLTPQVVIEKKHLESIKSYDAANVFSALTTAWHYQKMSVSAFIHNHLLDDSLKKKLVDTIIYPKKLMQAALKKYQEIALLSHTESHSSNSMILSYLLCGKDLKRYHMFDVNGIKVTNFLGIRAPQPISLLEAAMASLDINILNTLLDMGAEVQPTVPYLAIIVHACSEQFPRESVVDFILRALTLTKDLDLPFPSYLDSRRRTIARYLAEETDRDHRNRCLSIVELMLANGAHMSEISNKIGRYNPLDNKANIRQFVGSDMRWQHGILMYIFNNNNAFVRKDSNGEQQGKWYEMDEHRLQIVYETDVDYYGNAYGDSHAPSTVPEDIALIFRCFNGEVAMASVKYNYDGSYDVNKMLYDMWIPNKPKSDPANDGNLQVRKSFNYVWLSRADSKQIEIRTKMPDFDSFARLTANRFQINTWIWFKHPAPKSTAFPELAIPPRLTFGEIFSIMKASAGKKNGFFEVVQKKYGPLVWIRVPFWSDIALFTSPEHAKTFFAAKEADFLRGYFIFHKIASPPVFYKTKTYLTEVFVKAFSAERYSYFAKLLKRQVDEYLDQHWSGESRTINLFEEVDHLTLNGMIRSFLGDDLKGADLDKFVELVKELDIEDRMKSLKRVMYYSMPWGKKTSTEQFNQVIQLVTQAIDNRIATKNSEPDFFNFLIQELRTPSGGPDYELISLAIFSIIFAGTTNTYATSAWCLAFVSSDANLRAKVMEEKDQYFAALKAGEDVASLLINGLPFTTRLIYETVRICIGGFAPRYSMQDLNVADKYVIPKDWYLIFPYGLISHNPSIYSAPDSHNPDRFLTEAKEPYQNVSFGAGRHPCTGVKFATMNIKTLVFSFLDRYEAKMSDRVLDLMPKEQVMGVFRPVKPCMVQLTPKAK